MKKCWHLKHLTPIFFLVVAGLRAAPADTVNVTQHHNHDSRGGLFIDPVFTQAAAANLARDTNFNGTIVGNVYAQPLYIENGPGGAAMVIAVTESNNVYALDATTGGIIWQRNVGTAITSGLPCGNINPLGITGTPIVDLVSRSLFLDAETTPTAGTFKHLIFSLNVDTGATNAGWPVDVNAAVSGFDSSVQSERAALGIVGNIVYVPYGGRFGDCGVGTPIVYYRGRLVGVQMNNPASITAWATTSTRAGIWGPGGVASDGVTPFVTTGNGSGSTWGGNEAVIRLQPGPVFSGSTNDYWAPTNWQTLDSGDSDLGGSGPIIVDVPGATPSALVVAIGKDRNAYLLNRNALGGVSTPLAQAVVSTGTVINAAATYRTSLGTYVVLRPVSGTLTAFRITATNPPTIATGWSVSSSGRSSPFVTSTDGANEVIVWAVGAGGDQRLHGYNGDTGAVVYAGGGANELMAGARIFNTGIAARGRIYVANDNKVYAFTVPSSTPTPTPTATPTPAPSPTPTPTPTLTPTPTPALVATVSLPTAIIDPLVTSFTQPVATSMIDPADNLIGFQGDFTFDSTVVSFSATPVQKAGLTSDIDADWDVSGNVLPGPGPIRTLRVSALSNSFTPLDGFGTLFNLRMVRVSSTPGASTPLTWAAPPANFIFIGGDLTRHAPGSTPPGSITIQTPTINISGSISYCSNPVPGPVPGVTLTLTGTSGGAMLSDGSGNYTFASLASGGSYAVTPAKSALAPGSTGIDTVDVAATRRHYLQIVLLSGCQLAAADVNGDAVVDTTDILAIQRFYLGQTTGIANVGKYQFNPVNRSYLGINGDQTAQNYDTLVFGDVASDFVHLPEISSETAADEGASAGEVSATVAAIALPEIAVDRLRMISRTQSKTFVAPVTTTAIDAKNKLIGFQGDFTFDERVIGFQGEPVQKTGITGGNWNVSGNVLPGAGPIRTLRISACSNDFTPLSGSGTLFELKMTRMSQATQSPKLLWATPSNQFIFIDADLKTHKPGSVTPSGNAAR